ncbi:lysozyme inhibitor LprI family protein [Pseudogracilibacillus sp. ICA-222130]|uniref:lysozyme inhibitor LprI family protein n=1 Tax=Pseudogracilibacillus sp. ICA-222130 TaxID=3134655 RepID=UPI0030C1FAAE
MKRFLLISVAIFVLAACSSPYDDLLKEGNEAFDKGEYDQALKLYEYALDEEGDGKEAKEKIELIDMYKELNSMDEDDWDETYDLANNILKHDAINDKMKKEVKETLTTVEKNKEEEEKLLASLDKIEKDIKNEKFEKAAKALEDFDFTIDSSEVYDRHKELGYALEDATIAFAEKEREKEEKKAEKKRKEEEKKAEEKRKEEEKKAAASQSKYDKYYDKAMAIESRMKDAAYDAGYMHDYSMISYKFVSDWDNLLNEVWDVLKEDLPSDVYDELLEDQREWIKNKEAEYKEYSDKVEADTYLGYTTMNRTVYLITHYIDY